jgi:hypothetical protein
VIHGRATVRILTTAFGEDLALAYLEVIGTKISQFPHELPWQVLLPNDGPHLAFVDTGREEAAGAVDDERGLL